MNNIRNGDNLMRCWVIRKLEDFEVVTFLSQLQWGRFNRSFFQTQGVV
jgi:hypothetical protein